MQENQKQSGATGDRTPAYVVWSRRVLFLGLLVAILIAWGMPRVNEDLFVSLRCGAEAITKGLTAGDTSSFTREGRIFVNRGWLSHIMLYLSFSYLSAAGPVLAKGILLSGCLVIVFVRCRQLGMTTGVSLLSLTLGTLALAPSLGIRAENFGMFWFVLMATAVNGPGSWGRWRQVAALAVLVIWSNSHGTFVIGFGFLAARLIVEVARKWGILTPSPTGREVSAESDSASASVNAAPSSRPDSDLAGWVVTCVAAVVLMAIASPFGFDNIRIPLNKFIGFQDVIPWNDYLPLLHWDSIFQDRLFKPFSVVPFLALIGVFGLLFVGLLASLGPRGACSVPEMTGGRIDPYLEFVMAGMMIPLVFMWQRLILFAALSFIPPLAILLTVYARILRDRAVDIPLLSRLTGNSIAGLGAASVWVVLLTITLYSSVVRLYLPGNPTSPSRVERPLLSRMMSSHLVAQGVAEFMRTNQMQGRVFATLQLADYLLLQVPGIKVFFDLRTHVAYPFEIFKTYYSILGTGPQTIEDTLRALERYHVDFVVLDTMLERRGFVLAAELMSSKKWGCIYKDDWIFVLAPKDSKRFGRAIQDVDLSSLRYPSHRTRIVSEAVLSFFQKGRIPEQMLQSLQSVVRSNPDPDLYTLIVSAMNGNAACLNPVCKRYLKAEAARLGQMDPNVAGGVPFILESLARVEQLLETSELVCGSPASAAEHAKIKREVEAKSAALLARYSVF